VAYGPGQADSPYPAVPSGPGSANTWYPVVPAVDPAWLASSADRERAVGVIRAGFTEGRLTQDELADRIARAYAARTYGDLWGLTADLPAGALPYPDAPYPGAPYPGAPPAGMSGPQATPAVPGGSDPANWHSAAALIITALVIFTLAALVTAIATVHAQPVPFQPGPMPFQHAQLAPFITTLGGRA
jgi:Domain of unknown function (DUF1707)